MDYVNLAMELFSDMGNMRKVRSQRVLNDLLQGEVFVLQYIAKSHGEVQPGEISIEMNVSTARIATALNSLEKKGLITRRIDTNNRRHIIVGITPEGEALAEEQRRNAYGIIAKMLESLGEHDAVEYVRIMRKLTRLLPEHVDCLVAPGSCRKL